MQFYFRFHVLTFHMTAKGQYNLCCYLVCHLAFYRSIWSEMLYKFFHDSTPQYHKSGHFLWHCEKIFLRYPCGGVHIFKTFEEVYTCTHHSLVCKPLERYWYLCRAMHTIWKFFVPSGCVQLYSKLILKNSVEQCHLTFPLTATHTMIVSTLWQKMQAQDLNSSLHTK